MTTIQNALVSQLISEQKYLQSKETVREGAIRVANALKSNDEHYLKLKELLLADRFLPAGRILSAMGAVRSTTPYNCYVSETIEDSMEGITRALSASLQTMRLGGGIGYDFSTLRPSGDRISSLDSTSCGPVGDDENPGFMDLFDAGCAVIRSAGHRRGAQMGVLRVDHPDIYNFIRAKRNKHRLRNFNVSVAVTDEFMTCLAEHKPFALRWQGKVYQWVDPKNLWDEIMRSTWEHAEPGVLFIDTINKKNNLWYCESIAATNPCGEQPLPPHGACLLGSMNLVKYIKHFIVEGEKETKLFSHTELYDDVQVAVEALDNVVDRAIYPLPEQEHEAKSKRRMGLGVTGLANAAEILGFPYGSPEMLEFTDKVLRSIRRAAYKKSIDLAKERGPFPLFDKKLLDSEFARSLPNDIREDIYQYGIRNSHLLSIAPTGTISLKAGNVSSGVEPPFITGPYQRNVILDTGEKRSFIVQDYAEYNYGVVGKTSFEITAEDHVKVLNVASKFVDSSVSKTCNVGPNVTYEQFKDLYLQAYYGGSSGCTTYREGNIENAPLQRIDDLTQEQEVTGSACFYDPETGQKSCE